LILPPFWGILGAVSTGPVSKRRILDLRGGGWVVALAILLSTGIFSWRVIQVLGSRGERAVGDGKNPATYGFDLSSAVVPAEEIVASGLPKDGIRAIQDPSILTREQVDAQSRREKLLVSSDRVIGVVVGDQARAYPIRILNWHEVINDTLDGRPIAVTYSPLCDAAVVFDRRVGGEVLRFGVSGLLYNSNLLMYDRRPDRGGESLWSQLGFRAIAGPASGRRLDLLPIALISWGEWRELHPATTVLAPLPGLMDQYKADAYGSYFGTPKLRFPVRPAPPPDGLAPKTPIFAVRNDEGWVAASIPAVVSYGGVGGGWGSVSVSAQTRADPQTVLVTTQPSTDVVYAFWFAWHAFHPETRLVIGAK
jgi:hypothetical protein